MEPATLNKAFSHGLSRIILILARILAFGQEISFGKCRCPFYLQLQCVIKDSMDSLFFVLSKFLLGKLTCFLKKILIVWKLSVEK